MDKVLVKRNIEHLSREGCPQWHIIIEGGYPLMLYPGGPVRFEMAPWPAATVFLVDAASQYAELAKAQGYPSAKAVLLLDYLKGLQGE
ncbi:MAG: hypothetical protein ACRC8D_07210 [Aeromonas sp.]